MRTCHSECLWEPRTVSSSSCCCWSQLCPVTPQSVLLETATPSSFSGTNSDCIYLLCCPLAVCVALLLSSAPPSPRLPGILFVCLLSVVCALGKTTMEASSVCGNENVSLFAPCTRSLYARAACTSAKTKYTVCHGGWTLLWDKVWQALCLLNMVVYSMAHSLHPQRICPYYWSITLNLH